MDKEERGVQVQEEEMAQGRNRFTANRRRIRRRWQCRITPYRETLRCRPGLHAHHRTVFYSQSKGKDSHMITEGVDEASLHLLCHVTRSSFFAGTLPT